MKPVQSIEPVGSQRTEALNAWATRIYFELALMSEASAASLGQHVSSSKPGTKTPTLSAEPGHLLFLRRYNGCRRDDQRRDVIKDGLAEIKDARYSRRPTIDCQTLEGRLTVGRDTRPAEVVAYTFGFSVRHVHRLRADARRYDERYGRRDAA